SDARDRSVPGVAVSHPLTDPEVCMSASPSRPRIAVTGLGTVNPLGGDVSSTWQAALAGTSTARTLDNDWKDVHGLSVDFACELAPGALDALPRPQAKKLDPSGQYSMVAAREA